MWSCVSCDSKMSGKESMALSASEKTHKENTSKRPNLIIEIMDGLKSHQILIRMQYQLAVNAQGLSSPHLYADDCRTTDCERSNRQQRRSLSQ